MAAQAGVRLSVADAGSPTCAAVQHAAVPTVRTQTWQVRMKAMSLLRPPAKKVRDASGAWGAVPFHLLHAVYSFKFR